MIPPIGPPGRLFSRRAVTMRRTAPWTGAVHFTEAVLLHRLSILALLAALGCAGALVVCPGVAAAEEAPVPPPTFVVVGVAVPGFGGEMTALPTDQSTAAALVFNEAQPEGAPLRMGATLAPGDRIRCTRARVVIRRGDDEYIHVHEGAEVTLTAERSIIQSLGEVYYRVREAFRVEYGTVETTVEGTRFLVAGDEAGAVAVSVDEGIVSVRTPSGSQAVSAGQTLSTLPTAAPPGPTQWAASARGRALAKTVGMGRPRVMVGALAQGAWTGASAETIPGVGAIQLRPMASIRVAGPVRVLVEPGVARGASTVQLPVNAGVELSVAGFSFGGSATATRETRTAACGASQDLLHLGGAGHVRAELPLGRHLRALGAVRVGLASVWNAELGAGVGWAF